MWPGTPILAKPVQGCFRELGHCIFHDFLRRRAAQLSFPPGRKCWSSQGADVFTGGIAAASFMTSLRPGC